MRRAVRISSLFGAAALAAAVPTLMARADHAPTIVVPGRADVPVIIDGIDATWGVAYGDWGLSRPGHRGVTIESGPLFTVIAPPPAYYPATGHRPRYGRDEVLPRRPARPAQAYHRSWSTGPAPRDLPPARPFFEDDLPRDPPPVIPAPPER